MLPVIGIGLLSIAVVENPGDVGRWVALPCLLVILTPGVMGFLVLRRDDRNRIGWLLCAHAALVGTAFSTPPEGPGPLPR